MKKFLRMLGSGYLLVLLILLIEVAAIGFVQWLTMGDGLTTLGIVSEKSSLLQTLIVFLAYIVVKLAEFIVGLIIFFKIVIVFYKLS